MDKKQIEIIQACRDQITNLDQEIFSLIKRREQLSAQIGEAKRELKIPDHDPTREKAVFEHALTMAKTLDLPVTLATSLQKLIIDLSLSRQERDRIKNNPPQKILEIVIIGGAGRMGGWFTRFLSDSGHNIHVIDIQKPNFYIKNYSSKIDSSLQNKDLIIIATPIRISNNILNTLSNFKLSTPVIFDISSVKAPLYNSLKKLQEQGGRVTSLHPMFGPSVELLFGKHIIITSLGVQEADILARNIFSSTALSVVEMSIDQHDETMAYVLSLSHIINIIFILALSESNIPITNLESLASPTFSHVLSQAYKVFDENPHLYYEIQALNPHNKKSHAHMRDALKQILQAIDSHQEQNFIALMKKGRTFLGGTCDN